MDADYGNRLREAASYADGPVYMLSLASFRPGSGQVLGPDFSHDPDGRYAPIPLLTGVGAVPCFVADVVAGFGGWHRVGVIRYPSRRAFVELTQRREAMEWHAKKERRVDRLILLGMLPTAGLPAAEPCQRVLVEIWSGPEPGPLADGPATTFEVEGTYIGDGRQWSGARYTPIELGTALPLQPARFGYQALLVEPTLARWEMP